MTAPHRCHGTLLVLRRSRRLALQVWGGGAVFLGVCAILVHWKLKGNLKEVFPLFPAALACLAVVICIYLLERYSHRLTWGTARCNQIQALKETGEDPPLLARLERELDEELDRPIGGLFG